LSTQNKCRLCEEEIIEYKCSYCGFENPEVLDNELDKKAQDIKRNEILLNIDSVGIVILSYTTIENDKPIFSKEELSLVTSPKMQDGKITGIFESISISHYDGDEIHIYKTVGKLTEELPPQKISVQGELFKLSGKINNNLKLDIYCNEGSEPILKNIKLGNTLCLP